MGNIIWIFSAPDAVAASRLVDGSTHGDAAVDIADLAGELIDGLKQTLPSQGGGVHRGGGGHNCYGFLNNRGIYNVNGEA